MDRERSKQPGTSNDFFLSPFPHPELPLSKLCFALGPFWKPLPNHAAFHSCQITADSEVSYFQAGDKWCLMPLCEALVHTHGKRPSSSWELLCCYGCYPDVVQAEPWSCCLGGKAAVPNIHRAGMPKNIPYQQFAVHYMPKLWGSTNCLTDTNLPLHGPLAHSSSTVHVICACKVRNIFLINFTDEKAGLVLQYKAQPLWC